MKIILCYRIKFVLINVKCWDDDIFLLASVTLALNNRYHEIAIPLELIVRSPLRILYV